MRNYVFILSMAVLSGCAAMNAKPYKGDLKKTYVEDTSLAKNEAYERSQVWLAKNLGDSNSAVKINDKEAGRLFAKILYPCKGIKDLAILSPPFRNIQTNVEINVKDKKVRYLIEMLGYTDTASGMPIEMPIADLKGQTEAVEACFAEIKKDLKSALGAPAAEKSW